MLTERVLITVKTYPTLSRKYGETVCTAGIRPDGSWMRIYPVPFRRLEDAEQYKKYDWIETKFRKARFDCRPETHHPVDAHLMLPVDHIDTADGWRERKKLILGKSSVYHRLHPLLDAAKENRFSLATFKPTRLLDFLVEDDEREWPEGKVAAMRQNTQQGQLFSEDEWRRTFELIPKLPYRFRYRFLDADGRSSTLPILDWECGQLFWRCHRKYGGNEEVAIEKVRHKYWSELPATDLHFFMGTLQEFHGFSENPWAIVGLFYPPHRPQGELNLD